MNMEIARELQINPWDGLLAAVRISAWKVADYERRLAAMQAQHGEDVDRPEQMARSLVIDSANERRHLARVSKAAVDAGVAERMVRQVEMEGAVIVQVMGAALDALNLDPDRRVLAHSVIHRELLALESPEDLLEQPG